MQRQVASAHVHGRWKWKQACRADIVARVEQLHSYPKHEVPPEFAWQIVSYQRIQWPFLYGKSNQGWDYTPRVKPPVSFILADEQMLISHAAVNQRMIEFAGERWNCYGVSSVFTYPAFRKGGYASRVVQAATAHILKSDGDLAMLFCGEPLRAFYSTCGWTPADHARIFYGDHQNQTQKSDNLIMMLFISDRGKRIAQRITAEPVYVGATTW